MLFVMFDLGQKMSLESFQIWLVVFFCLIEPSFLSEIGLFSETWISIQSEETKKIFLGNTGHIILELCNILEKFQFTTNKVVLDICYENHRIQVVEWLIVPNFFFFPNILCRIVDYIKMSIMAVFFFHKNSCVDMKTWKLKSS